VSPERRQLVLVWAGLLNGLVMFTGVAAFVGPVSPGGMPEVFIWTMLGMTVLFAALAHVMPRVLSGEVRARSIVGFGLAEGAALLSAVAWLLTGDVRSLAGLVLGFLSLAMLFPRDQKPGGDETVRLIPPR
jgi:hypothetical protein